MKLRDDASEIMDRALGSPKAMGFVSTEKWNRCAELVNGLCRSGLRVHAEQHASGVRQSLGTPWSPFTKTGGPA